MFERAYNWFSCHTSIFGALVYWLAVPTLLLLYVVGVREPEQRTHVLWRHNVTGETIVTDYVSNELMSDYSSMYLENKKHE